jgi:hypothetical protein
LQLTEYVSYHASRGLGSHLSNFLLLHAFNFLNFTVFIVLKGLRRQLHILHYFDNCVGQFGGKLLSFGNDKLPASHQNARPDRPVFISQVVTETEFVTRSKQLEKTLADGYFMQFCDEKIAGSRDSNEATVWSFLKVHFSD